MMWVPSARIVTANCYPEVPVGSRQQSSLTLRPINIVACLQVSEIGPARILQLHWALCHDRSQTTRILLWEFLCLGTWCGVQDGRSFKLDYVSSAVELLRLRWRKVASGSRSDGLSVPKKRVSPNGAMILTMCNCLQDQYRKLALTRRISLLYVHRSGDKKKQLPIWKPLVNRCDGVNWINSVCTIKRILPRYSARGPQRDENSRRSETSVIDIDSTYGWTFFGFSTRTFH